MSKETLKKTKIVKEDGRYLIYYTFDDDNDRTASERKTPDPTRRPSSSDTKGAGKHSDGVRRDD